MDSESHTLSGDHDNLIHRQSNFELLRIFAMIIIVAHHFSVHGGFEFSTDSITINRLWFQFIQIGGKIGVNIFVLISGFFLIDSRKLKLSKILKLWLQIIFYSILIFAVFVAVGLEPFSIKELIKSLFPVTYQKWWFASTYFVLYLFSALINIFLTGLNKKAYQRLLLLLTVCWYLIPTIFHTSYQSNNFLWFFCLYAVSGYIKLWAKPHDLKSKTYFLLAVITTLLSFLITVVFDVLGLKFHAVADYATIFYDMQQLPIVLISLFIFLGFMKTEIKYNKFINTVSSATFGVYLIHDNGFVSTQLWPAVFKGASNINSYMLIPYSIIVIILIFAVCTAIDLIRIYAFEKPVMTIASKATPRLDNIIKKILNSKLFEKI